MFSKCDYQVPALLFSPYTPQAFDQVKSTDFIILFHLSESDIVAEHEASIGSTFAPYNRFGRIDAKSGIRLIMHHRICNSKILKIIE